MVLWRAKVLALDLRDGRVAERDKLGYLLVGLLIKAVIGSASLLSAPRSLGAALGILIVLSISIAGAIATFRANARGDGRQFLERYLCLAVPVGIQMYVGYGALASLLYLLTGWHAPTAGSNLVSWAAWSLLYYGAILWFYFALRRHMAVAAGATVAPSPA